MALLDALAGRADVTVSLPYEPGRAAFASLSGTMDDLGALAGMTTVGGTLAAEAEELAAEDDSDEAADGDGSSPEPDPSRAPVPTPGSGTTSSKRERRKQRRATRPHGRAR